MYKDCWGAAPDTFFVVTYHLKKGKWWYNHDKPHATLMAAYSWWYAIRYGNPNSSFRYTNMTNLSVISLGVPPRCLVEIPWQVTDGF